MNQHSHILMGSLLCEYVREKHGIYLDKNSFLYGNVAPDLRISIVTCPHYFKNRQGFVHREMEALISTSLASANIDKEYSTQLGNICHYYSDFFCLAHNDRKMKRNIVTHREYERNLQHQLTAMVKSADLVALIQTDVLVMDQTALSMSRRLKGLHGEYLNTEPSYEKDIVYALHACAETIVSLVNCSVTQGAYQKTRLYPAYATIAG